MSFTPHPIKGKPHPSGPFGASAVNQMEAQAKASNILPSKDIMVQKTPAGTMLTLREEKASGTQGVKFIDVDAYLLTLPGDNGNPGYIEAGGQVILLKPLDRYELESAAQSSNPPLGDQDIWSPNIPYYTNTTSGGGMIGNPYLRPGPLNAIPTTQNEFGTMEAWGDIQFPGMTQGIYGMTSQGQSLGHWTIWMQNYLKTATNPSNFSPNPNGTEKIRIYYLEANLPGFIAPGGSKYSGSLGTVQVPDITGIQVFSSISWVWVP